MLKPMTKGLKGKMYVYFNIQLPEEMADILNAIGEREASDWLEVYLREKIKEEKEKLSGEIE